MSITIFDFIDEILRYSLYKRNFYPDKNKRKKAKLEALNIYFNFMNGPHKFVRGRYPSSFPAFYKLLRHSLFDFVESKRMWNLNITLMRLFEKIPEEDYRFVIFIICLANVIPQKSKIGCIRSPLCLSLTHLASKKNINTSFKHCDSTENCNFDKRMYYPDMCCSSSRCMNAHKNLLFMGAFSSLGDSEIYLNNFKIHSSLSIPDEYLTNPYNVYHRKLKTWPSASQERKTKIIQSLPNSGEDRHLHTLFQNSPYLQSVVTNAINVHNNDDSVSINLGNDVIVAPSWESRGCLSTVLEKPYITESGLFAMHAVLGSFKSRFQMVSNEDQTGVPPQTRPILSLDSISNEQLAQTRRSFLHDLLLAYTGVVSRRFAWQHVDSDTMPALSGWFVWREQTLDTIAFQVSSGALASFISWQLRAATAYRRLDWHCATSGNACNAGGSVSRAFVHALNQWMRAYAISMATVQQQIDTDHLLRMSQRLQPFFESITLVAHVCGLMEDSSGDPSAVNLQILSLRGISLLSYFASHLDAAVIGGFAVQRQHSFSVIRFLFNRACLPFVQFMHTWISKGICKDPYNEFNLIVNPGFLDRRDISFWKQGVTFKCIINDSSNHLSLPNERKHASGEQSTFLGLVPPGFEHGIRRCGLSLNLLRLLAPNHFIFKCHPTFPSLHLSNFNFSDHKLSLQTYSKHVDSCGTQARVKWFNALVDDEKAKSQLLIKATATAKKTRQIIQEQDKRLHEIAARKKSDELAILCENTEGSHVQNLVSTALNEAIDTGFVEKRESLTSTHLTEQEIADNSHNLDGLAIMCDEKLQEHLPIVVKQRIPLSPANMNISTISLAAPSPLDTGKKQLRRVRRQSIENIPLTTECMQRNTLSNGFRLCITIQSNRHDNRAREIMYGKGIGPTARENTWKKACNLEHSTDEDILAFSTELLKPHKSVASFETGLPSNHDSQRLGNLSEYLRSVGMPVANSGRCNSYDANHLAIPFFHLLDRCLKEPILIQVSLVDRYLLEYFLTDLHLLDHLHFARQIFFHEHAELSSRILEALSEKISKRPGSSRENWSPKLANLIQIALSDVKIEQAKLFCGSELPFHLMNLQTPDNSLDLDENVSFFDRLALVYEAPWPLNICLHKHVLAKYSTVFCELSRIKHAIWALESVFHHLRKQNRQLDPASGGLFQISIWRHEMDQVIRCLDAYFATQAVFANWPTFVRQIGASACVFSGCSQLPDTCPETLTTVTNLDEFCAAHEHYVDEVLRRCLITGADTDSIHDSILGLLSAVHRFRKTLLADCMYENTCLRTLMEIMSAFKGHARSIRRFLRARFFGLQSNGALIELSQLVYTLGTCDFYAPT